VFDKWVKKHEDHIPIYENLLNQLPLLSNVLEIGIGSGGMLRTIMEFRPDLQLVGLDNFSESYQRGLIPTDLATMIIGEQTDEEALADVAALGPYHLIMDDCSHIAEKQKVSLGFLFPHLAPGGFYVIEDLHASGAGQKTRDFVDSFDLATVYHSVGGLDKDVVVIKKDIEEVLI
jgi:cephalosporin hydroxylase